MDDLYRLHFRITNLEKYEAIPGFVECMESELMRVYDIYADKVNNGITDELNAMFDKLYPTYFKDNEGKEWYDLTEYNQFMANGYQHLIVDELNEMNVSPLLDFFVDPKEITLKGYLKLDRTVTIEFYMEKVYLS